ncbi:MAG TPA: DUF3047 domain-containing protein [Gammaproteobacteria bacterium]|nr:DUF3047 domain-containing protein [Gammaproteobacteria bacterium]
MFLAAALAVAGAMAEAEQGIVPLLQRADIITREPWKFVAETRYAPVEIDGRRAIKAVSDSSASGTYRKITIDLYETPVLRWSCRVENTLGNIAETDREDDHCPARVSALAAHPLLFWKTRVLSYVRCSAQPEESDWPSACIDSVKVIAVCGGEPGLGEWHEESPNVRKDLQQHFGKAVRYVDAVGFMTDSDDSGRRAVAYCGDV